MLDRTSAPYRAGLRTKIRSFLLCKIIGVRTAPYSGTRPFSDGALGFAPALSFTAGEFDLLFERVRKTLDDVLADAAVQRALDVAHTQPA